MPHKHHCATKDCPNYYVCSSRDCRQNWTCPVCEDDEIFEELTRVEHAQQESAHEPQ